MPAPTSGGGQPKADSQTWMSELKKQWYSDSQMILEILSVQFNRQNYAWLQGVSPRSPPPPHTRTHTHTNTHTYTSFTDIATYHKSKNYFIISQSIFIWWGSSLIELHGISPRFVVYQFIEIKLFLCNPRQPYEIDISFIRYIFPYFLYIS